MKYNLPKLVKDNFQAITVFPFWGTQNKAQQNLESYEVENVHFQQHGGGGFWANSSGQSLETPKIIRNNQK